MLPIGALLCVLAGQGLREARAEGTSAHPVISEVMWPGSDLSTADEWLEIACVGQDVCDLSGWSLTSLKSTGEDAVIVTFGAGSYIAAGEAKVVSHYPAASSRLALEPWIVTSALSLPNTKLLLKLRDTSGVIQDAVDDGVGNPFAGANPSGGTKAGMERIDLLASGSDAANWRTATLSSGFKPGAEIFGTPGVIPNDRTPEDRTPEDRSHEGLLLSAFSSDGASSADSSGSSASDRTPEDRTPGGVLLSSSASDGASSSGSATSSQSWLSLLSSSSDRTPGGVLLSSVSSESSESSDSFPSFPSSSSFSSSSSQVADPLLTRWYEQVRITEVLANPIGVDTNEWIEVGNPGTQAVNIAGWVLDDGNSVARYVIPSLSDAGFLLAPGAYASFRKSVTALPLDNAGERVSLMSGSLLIDAWVYPLTAEEVSYGRDPLNPDQLRPFCVPSEGKANTTDALAPRIMIQDAGAADVGASFVSGSEHVSLNLQAAVGAGSLASAACIWDYGDDAVSTVCNPPSHRFDDPGDYTVRLTVRDFCGGIGVSTLTVAVLPEADAEDVTSDSSIALLSSSSRCSSSSLRSSASSHVSDDILMSLREDSAVETVAILSEVQMVGDEWIELFNPTDHDIDLSGWILDDLKNGGPAPRSSAKSEEGSKPWNIPPNTIIEAGEYLLFSKSQTKLALNDGGDDVWLIAPDGNWSQHIAVTRLKAGTSFSFCEEKWSASQPTPGTANACQSIIPASSTSSVSTSKKPIVSNSPSFLRVRYVVASSESSLSSLTSLSSDASGSLIMSNAETELPPLLTVTGRPQRSVVPEVSVVGSLGTIGAVLFWLKRKFVP